MGYNEWSEVLVITVCRVSGCSPPTGSSAALIDGDIGKRACTKEPILILWMQCSFLRFKLEEPHIRDRDRRQADRGRVQKRVAFYYD